MYNHERTNFTYNIDFTLVVKMGQPWLIYEVYETDTDNPSFFDFTVSFPGPPEEMGHKKMEQSRWELYDRIVGYMEGRRWCRGVPCMRNHIGGKDCQKYIEEEIREEIWNGDIED